MKQRLMIIGMVVVIFLLGIFIFKNKKQDMPSQQVCYQNYCWNLEIAKTAEEKQKGLMFRQNLDENQGMLFDFQTNGIYPFWMKNTFMALDMLWLDQDLKVVFIKNHAQPCAKLCPIINPQVNARYVLEIKGGIAEKLKIKQGDILNFP